MATKKEKFTPIEIDVNEPNDVFEEHRETIARAIVHAINANFKGRKKHIDFARIIVKGYLVITLSIDRREFEDLLEEQLKTLVEFEDYRTCAIIMELKKKYETVKI